ncbi:MAG: phage tail sheath family protein, partial [Lachnospiraceae bacterium]|nr:phage tail sheath family protein [Lachnospiraceae bacterium]
MPDYFSPGVYVEEIDNAPRSVEGVGTSTAGFVGMAERGPVGGAPTLVTNFKSFTRQFGGALSEYTHGDYRYLAGSVEQFFANGGTRCYISRVVPDDAAPSAKKMGILDIKAANPGKWGNRIQISLHSVNKRKMQLVKKTSDNTYTAKSVEGFREGDIVVFNGEYNRIQMIYDDQVTFEAKFRGNPVDEGLIPKTVVYLVTFDMMIRYNDQTENYFDLTLNSAARSYIATRLSQSSFVKVEVAEAAAAKSAPAKDDKGEAKGEAVNTIGNPVEQILGKGVTEGTFTLEGGSDGSIGSVNAGTFIGDSDGPNGRTGIQSFLENDVVNLLAAPGITIPE